MADEREPAEPGKDQDDETTAERYREASESREPTGIVDEDADSE